MGEKEKKKTSKCNDFSRSKTIAANGCKLINKKNWVKKYSTSKELTSFNFYPPLKVTLENIDCNYECCDIDLPWYS